VDKKAKFNQRWALIIGFGMALTPMHSSVLTELVTNDGTVGFFIPAFGHAIWIMATLWYCNYNWVIVKESVKSIQKIILIPLIVIVVSMAVSGFITGDTLSDKVSPLLMGISLLSLFIVSRVMGKAIFLAFVPMVVIISISCVAYGLISPGQYTGGLITNYCAAAGYLILGTIINPGKWQWVLIIVASIGVFFIGALEAVFILGVLAIVMMFRRDWGKRLVVLSIVMAVGIGVWAIMGHLTPLYEGNQNLSTLFQMITGSVNINTETMVALTSGRWEVIIQALKDTQILGHGYSLSTVEGGIVHNLPLIIMHQIRPLAALAWAFITVYCLVKTRWVYAWVAIIAVCVFDHYLWTQFTPLWWALVGVSTVSGLKSDLIWKRSE
jgi:hypothetical protein